MRLIARASHLTLAPPQQNRPEEASKVIRSARTPWTMHNIYVPKLTSLVVGSHQ